MRYVAAVVVAVVVIALFSPFDRLSYGDFGPLLVALVVAVPAAVGVFKFLGNASKNTTDVTDALRTARDKVSAMVDDSDSSQFYATAEEEADKGTYDKGLWSQALVKASGNESLRKITYIKLRVAQLKRQPSLDVSSKQ